MDDEYQRLSALADIGPARPGRGPIVLLVLGIVVLLGALAAGWFLPPAQLARLENALEDSPVAAHP